MEQTAGAETPRPPRLQAGSKASYPPQFPENMWRYTLRKLSSSQRSTEPPSTCGESPSVADPGGRRRMRSAYDGTSLASKCRWPSLSAFHKLFMNTRTIVSDSDCRASTCGRDQ